MVKHTKKLLVIHHELTVFSGVGAENVNSYFNPLHIVGSICFSTFLHFLLSIEIH